MDNPVNVAIGTAILAFLAWVFNLVRSSARARHDLKKRILLDTIEKAKIENNSLPVSELIKRANERDRERFQRKRRDS